MNSAAHTIEPPTTDNPIFPKRWEPVGASPKDGNWVGAVEPGMEVESIDGDLYTLREQAHGGWCAEANDSRSLEDGAPLGFEIPADSVEAGSFLTMLGFNEACTTDAREGDKRCFR